jgi:glycosyltransferase involved in cell wall biosynthesis
LSSNATPWGGSEELWAMTAVRLAREGHSVTVYKLHVDERQPRIRELRAAGCGVHDLIRLPFLPNVASSVLWRVTLPVMFAQQVVRTCFGLLMKRPDVVVVSQGGNLDGGMLADVCRRMKKPYVLIAQKATELYWPLDAHVQRLRRVYDAAVKCYFVSEHNRQLTEEQVGVKLPDATIVRNPFLVPYEPRTDWPDDDGRLRLACVGRLFPSEKGQDLLLRVLARDRWRKRPLAVTFFGDGPNRDAIETMAAHLGLTSVRFAGFAGDVAAIWNDHHALVLPSRCEGLPLVVVEAMLSGRVPIVTNVAGNTEVVTDGETGFVAATATEDALDDAMERAWQRRDEWRAIGARAAERIRTLVPADPTGVFAAELLRVATALAKRGEDVRDVDGTAPQPTS